MLLSTHIVAGGLAIVLGAVALVVSKGGTVHRRAGLVFVAAMLVMGVSGSLLGMRKSLTDSNGLGGLMTVYFVSTALTTVRPPAAWTRVVGVAAPILAAGIALVDVNLGVTAFRSARGFYNGVPFPMYFFMATVLTLAAFGDLRVQRTGPLRGGPRLARHLWRMCFALFIAAGSFLSIRSRVASILPDPFTSLPVRALPILLLFAAMFYWLWRVRRRPAAVMLTGRQVRTSNATRS